MVQCYLTGDSNVSSHEGTLAPPGEYDWTCASFGPLDFTTETANVSVQPFLHSLRHKVPILHNGHPYPPELRFPTGDLDLPCNTWCFGPMRAHDRNGTSIGSGVFAQMTAECPYMVCLFRPQNGSFPCWHLDLMYTWFIGTTQVRNTNGNLIVSAGLTSVIDWQSDRQTTLLRARWCNNA